MPMLLATEHLSTAVLDDASQNSDSREEGGKVRRGRFDARAGRDKVCGVELDVLGRDADEEFLADVSGVRKKLDMDDESDETGAQNDDGTINADFTDKSDN